jgi:hypothetical protein
MPLTWSNFPHSFLLVDKKSSLQVNKHFPPFLTIKPNSLPLSFMILEVTILRFCITILLRSMILYFGRILRFVLRLSELRTITLLPILIRFTCFTTLNQTFLLLLLFFRLVGFSGFFKVGNVKDFFCWSGNILNFNVGATVDLDVPRSFWSRLAGKYGNIFYWREKVSSAFQCLFFLLA